MLSNNTHHPSARFKLLNVVRQLYCLRAAPVLRPAASGSVRLSVRKLRLFGRLEVSLMREGPPGAKDVLAAWRR